MQKCHSERSEESQINGGRASPKYTEMFRFAQHDSGVEMTKGIDQKISGFSTEMSGILESAT